MPARGGSARAGPWPDPSGGCWGGAAAGARLESAQVLDPGTVGGRGDPGRGAGTVDRSRIVRAFRMATGTVGPTCEHADAHWRRRGTGTRSRAEASRGGQEVARAGRSWVRPEHQKKNKEKSIR